MPVRQCQSVTHTLTRSLILSFSFRSFARSTHPSFNLAPLIQPFATITTTTTTSITLSASTSRHPQLPYAIRPPSSQQHSPYTHLGPHLRSTHARSRCLFACSGLHLLRHPSDCTIVASRTHRTAAQLGSPRASRTKSRIRTASIPSRDLTSIARFQLSRKLHFGAPTS